MFLGQFQHTLDIKNRISIPKRFRDQLAPNAVLTAGLDGCLFLYPQVEWEALSRQMKDLPLTGVDARSFSRYLFSAAAEVSFDQLGRIVIPDYLIDHAKLRKKLIVIGVLNRVEIWSAPRWEAFNKNIAARSEEIAEKLSGTGI